MTNTIKESAGKNGFHLIASHGLVEIYKHEKNDQVWIDSSKECLHDDLPMAITFDELLDLGKAIADLKK